MNSRILNKSVTTKNRHSNGNHVITEYFNVACSCEHCTSNDSPLLGRKRPRPDDRVDNASIHNEGIRQDNDQYSIGHSNVNVNNAPLSNHTQRSLGEQVPQVDFYSLDMHQLYNAPVSPYWSIRSHMVNTSSHSSISPDSLDLASLIFPISAHTSRTSTRPSRASARIVTGDDTWTFSRAQIIDCIRSQQTQPIYVTFNGTEFSETVYWIGNTKPKLDLAIRNTGRITSFSLFQTLDLVSGPGSSLVEEDDSTFAFPRNLFSGRLWWSPFLIECFLLKAEDRSTLLQSHKDNYVYFQNFTEKFGLDIDFNENNDNPDYPLHQLLNGDEEKETITLRETIQSFYGIKINRDWQTLDYQTFKTLI
jgi:hypothetical protein